MPSLADLLVKVGIDASGLKAGLKSVSDDFKAMDKEIRATERALSGFQKMGDRAASVGASLTAGLTLPIAAIGVAATKVAGDFQMSFNKVQAFGDITGASLDRLKAQALDLGAKTAFSAQQAADGMAVFASAGLNANQIYAAMPGTLNLAAAGQLGVAEAATLAKDVLGQFGLEAAQTGRVADVMAQAAADASASLSEIATTLTYVGPVAHGAGQSLEETTAAIVALDAAGIRGEKAGTGLRGVLGSLISPSKAAAEELESLGIKIADSAGRIRPLSDIMEQFKQKLGGVTSEAERQRIIFAVFGREAGNAAQVLIKTGGPALDAFEQKLVTSGGAADKMAKVLQQGLKGSLEQFKGSVETAAISLGTALLPVMGKALDLGTAFVNNFVLPAVKAFGELPAPVQGVVLALAGLAAAAGPVIFALGQFVASITSISSAMTTFPKAASAVTGALGTIGSAAVLTAGAFAGWQLGKWAYDQVPGMKKLGDTIAEVLLKIPGMETLMNALSGALAAQADAVDASEFAIKKQEEALKRLGIVLNKEGLSTEEYAKRLRETVQQQIAMGKETTKTGESVKGIIRPTEQAAAAVQEYGKKTDKTRMAARDFLDIQPVLAARLRLVDSEYKANIESLVKLEKHLESVKYDVSVLYNDDETVTFIYSLRELGSELDVLHKNLGTLGGSIRNLPSMPAITGVTGGIKELDDLGKAYERLGVKTAGELRKIADQHQADFNRIKGSGIATAHELEQAWWKLMESLAAASRQAGEEIPIEIEAMLAVGTNHTKKATKEQESIWKDWGKQISTIVTDMGKSITQKIFAAFSGDHNRKLDEEAAKLQDSLGKRTEEWEKYQADVARQMEELRAKNAASLEKEEADLARALDKERDKYEDFTRDVGKKIEELRSKSAANLDREISDLADKLRDKESKYEEYVRNVGDKEQEIRRSHAERLASELDDLRDNLADKLQAYNRFVEDSNRKLSRIGEDLNESIRDATRSINRRLEDENTDYARDTEKLGDDLRKAEAKGDHERVREIRRSLQQREEDHQRTVKRLREDLAEQVRDARIRAEEQTADAKLQLDRRASDHAAFLAENAQREREARETHAAAEAKAIGELQAGVQKQTAELLAFREQTRIAMEEARALAAVNLATEVRDLQDSLAERTTQWETYQRDAADALQLLRNNHAIKLAEQEADLLRVLDDKRADYDAYVSDVNLKLAAIVEAHRSAWGEVKNILTSTLSEMGQALSRFGVEFLTEGLFKLLKKDLLGDILPSVAKAIGGIFGVGSGIASGAGKVAGAVGGEADELASIIGIGGSAAGAAGSAANTAAGVAGQAAGMGMSAVAGIVTGAVSAVSGVIGNFQMAGMNKSLDLIEKETRYSQIHLKELVERAQNIFLSELPAIRQLSAQFLDDHAWRIHDVWERLGTLIDVVRFETNMHLGGLEAAMVTAGPREVNIHLEGATFQNRADIDYAVEQISRNLR